jgi:hypothetical protein
MSDNRLPDYLDHMQQAVKVVYAFNDDEDEGRNRA